MIDVKKALSQRCYIIFGSNKQLLNFISENNLTPFVGISDTDTIISVHLDGDILTVPHIVDHDIPKYKHTELTYTDDGE